MSPLNTAELAIYAFLSLPALYILIRHGPPGYLGWFYLFAFCSLRVVGNALALGKNGNNSSASIISNIGLSPLLLATSGILHEARYYRNIKINQKTEWILVLLYHIFVATGVGLIASGASSLNNLSTAKPSDLTLLKVGIVILLLSWLKVSLWAFYSLLPNQETREATGWRDGSRILYAILLTLPFTGIRVLYSTVSIFSGNADLNPITGTLGLRVGLSFIPELISVLLFIGVGVWTAGVRVLVRRARTDEGIVLGTMRGGERERKSGSGTALRGDSV